MVEKIRTILDDPFSRMFEDEGIFLFFLAPLSQIRSTLAHTYLDSGYNC